MRGIFNPENGFWRVTGKIVDAALLSLFWIVCSLPVFTLGPATAALYKTSVKCLRGDETKSWSMFFLTFKENFKVGALTSLIDGTFDQNTDLFRELYDALLNGCGGRADEYFVLEDYADYARAQWDIDKAYRDQTKWAKMAIVNVAKSGKFSSDRTIRQYAEEIWDLKPLHIED